MHRLSLYAVGAALALCCLVMAPAPAAAGCFTQGCTDQTIFDPDELASTVSCNDLWEMRNSVFKERGYCFRTARAIRAFGNAGCRYDDEGALQLSRIERANVDAIRRAERLQRCPR